MELRQLRYFLSVADCRSFVSASSALFISRQAVSKAISQLESELGVELFVRDPSGAFLTPTGILFYERVRSILMDLDSLTEQMKTSGNRYHQRIRIAFAVGTVPLMEDRLLAYRDARENLELVYAEHTEQECLRLLLEHQADIAVTVQSNPSPQLISEELFSSPFGLLLSDSGTLEDMTEVDISDLTWVPLAVHPDKRTEEFCAKYRLSPQYKGQDYHRLFSLAASGRCGLILPQCLVPRNIPHLRWIPLRQQELWRLYCTYPQSAETNMLYSTVLEELYNSVLRVEQKEGV